MKNKKEIFSSKELSEIYLYLSRGDLPVKYAYKTEQGAEAWIELENNNKNKKGEYKTFSDYESDLLEKNQKTYLEKIEDDIVIFDFGCGEGNSVEEFLKNLSKTQKVFYHAFDISENILKKNKKRITKISKNIYYDSTEIDFEDSSFTEKVLKAKMKYKNQNVLALLLGSTVGNFSSINYILKNILSPLSVNDRLIVGIAKSNVKDKIKIEKIIESYNNKLVEKLTISTLKYFGLQKKNYEYFANFDESKKTVDLNLLFKKDSKFIIDMGEVNFEKGQKIRIGKSEKVDDVKMTKIFDDLNIRIVNMSTSDDDNYVQFCLSNKTYF